MRADRSTVPALQIRRLRKTYGPTVAVDDVSLTVEQGEIFGILGPNGAGKTTTVECALGLRHFDAGSIDVLGHDVSRERDAVHTLVGAQLQASSLPSKLRVAEILELFASFYRRSAPIGDLVAALGLDATLHAPYRSLSGGERQRLSIALALIGDPAVAVLDEMTTGLDPQARRESWDLIEGVRDRGVTLVLVTHYMDEAERLCDRVALIDRGRVTAVDTPSGLAGVATGRKLVRFRPSGPVEDRLLLDLPDVGGVRHDGADVVVTGTGDLVNAIILTLAAAGIAALDVEMRSANLEDAVIALTKSPPRAAAR